MPIKTTNELKEDVRRRTRGVSDNREFYKSLNDLAEISDIATSAFKALDITIEEEAADIIFIDLQIVGLSGPVAAAKSIAVYALDPVTVGAAPVTLGPGLESSTMYGVGQPQAIIVTDANGYARFGVTEDTPGDEVEALIKLVPIDLICQGALLTVQFDDQAEGGGGG
jgi:hypothetical protein